MHEIKHLELCGAKFIDCLNTKEAGSGLCQSKALALSCRTAPVSLCGPVPIKALPVGLTQHKLEWPAAGSQGCRRNLWELPPPNSDSLTSLPPRKATLSSGSAHRVGIPPVPQKHYLAQTSVSFGPCSRGPKLRAVRKSSWVSNFTVPAAGDTSLPNIISTSCWAPLLTRQKEHKTDFRDS